MVAILFCVVSCFATQNIIQRLHAYFSFAHTQHTVQCIEKKIKQNKTKKQKKN